MINNLKLSLVQAEAKFSEISQRMGSNHPTYAATKADVDKLRAELSRHMRATKNTAINQESEIRAALEEQKAKVLSLNRSRNELLLIAREVEGAQQAYNTAMQRLNQTSLKVKQIFRLCRYLIRQKSQINLIVRRYLIWLYLSFWELFLVWEWVTCRDD